VIRGQQLLEEQIQLLGVLLQVADVGGNLINLVDAHAALNPPVEGIPFVQGKVVAGVRTQQDDRLLQAALRLVFQGLFGPGEERSPLQIGADLPG